MMKRRLLNNYSIKIPLFLTQKQRFSFIFRSFFDFYNKKCYNIYRKFEIYKLFEEKIPKTFSTQYFYIFGKGLGEILRIGWETEMQQLECRFYSREEISKTLSIDLKDSKHFAERIKTTLEKWGYQYEYSRSGVMITGIPLLPEAQLREILIRKLNLDIQIDTYAFACFLCAFTDINHFDSMPWEERADKMLERYNVNVSDRTLRNWCRKLMDQNIIQKGGERTFWKTEIICGKKIRVNVPEGNEEMTNYFQKRSEYIQQEKLTAAADGLRGQEATNHAWAETYKQLWREFQCCYYACTGWTLNAIQEDFFFEIYELSQDLAAEKEQRPQPNKPITSKEEFHETWFTKKLV